MPCLNGGNTAQNKRGVNLIILNCSALTVAFGVDVILDKVSFSVNEGDKIGVVGVNGAGKSMLLKSLCGIVTPESGSVYLAKDTRISYLAQNAGFDSEKSVYDEMLDAFPQLVNDEMRLSELEHEMQKELPSELHMRIVSEYTSLEEQFRKNGGYDYKSRIRSMLSALGFDDKRQKDSVNTFSGGQKTRIALARVLLGAPDILMLDEPTNHLDIESVEWLEDYLKGYGKTLIVISHDRYFLDKITNKTLEVENKEVKLYPVSYTDYVKRKEEDRKNDEKHYQLQKKEIERLEAFIENQRRWNRERNIIAAESRMKAIDRMEKVEKPKNLPDRISFNFTSGKYVLLSDRLLEVKGLSKAFPPKKLFNDISFVVRAGDRLFISGANGVGKSTLLKILSGKLKPDSGVFEYVKGVRIGYYDQENQGLSPENTVLDELWNTYPDKKQSEIRGVLARFLFKADDVFKQVSVLSGGEKARLTFAKLMLDELNLLILDEPTNHLDASSREVLEDALINYDGTLIAVSHDRYFIKKLATRIFDISSQGCTDYNGGYEAFSEYKKKRALESKQSIGEGTQNDAEKIGKTDYIKSKEEKSRKRRLESRISKLEARISEIESRMRQIDAELEKNATDYQKTSELFSESEKLSEELSSLYEEWDSATSESTDI